jgi:hypothetical protein
MYVRIYQIVSEKDFLNLAFRNLHQTQKISKQKDINKEIYKKVFDGDVDCYNLEDVFMAFNLGCLENFTGHSLSVSDVVEVVSATEVSPGFYFCDSVGFKKVNFV